jgi:hypothetical protein
VTADREAREEKVAEEAPVDKAVMQLVAVVLAPRPEKAARVVRADQVGKAAKGEIA